MDLRWLWNRKRLVATRPFIVGVPNGTSFHVVKGTSIYFDGVTVQYGVDKFSCPNMAAALTRGWAVPWYKYRKDDPSYGRPEAAPLSQTTWTAANLGRFRETVPAADLTEAERAELDAFWLDRPDDVPASSGLHLVPPVAEVPAVAEPESPPEPHQV
jgi:hypothetical protein